jgi:hypothetical protein
MPFQKNIGREINGQDMHHGSVRLDQRATTIRYICVSKSLLPYSDLENVGRHRTAEFCAKSSCGLSPGWKSQVGIRIAVNG